MKSWLQDNNIEMYSTHNERNSVVDENLFRTLRNTIYKYMTSISKNGNGDKIVGFLYRVKKKLQKTNQEEFRIEKERG